MTHPTDTISDAQLPPTAVQDIIDATAATLETICQKKIRTTADTESPPDDGLSASIRCHGELSFDIVFHVPRDTARPLATKFAGVPIDFDCEVMPDLIGELTNVIAGAVAARLTLAGFTTDISLPVITSTPDAGEEQAPVERMRLDAGFGPLYLTIRRASAATDKAD